MRTLNLGILAHVDAGKTSLTERLLYAAGVIDRLGSVDGGNTQTDTMALERQRGITIKAAVEVPADVLAAALSVLARLDALPGQPVLEGASYAVEGEIAAARVHELQQLLPGLTHGEGALETSFAGYRAVAGEPPTRRRSDDNPLNRKEYLLHVQRRVPTSIGEAGG